MRSDPYAIPSGPGETILGDQLSNPYDITTMNAAYQSLFGTTATLLPTHYYIKWLPADGEDVAELSAYEEEHDYEFELQPLHYEVLYDGDEGYIDPAVPQNGGIAPEYGAVTAAHYTTNQLPDVPYQLLNTMYIPKYESRLTFTAFVMSGNERFYEAVDGYCHPDCPTWPDCLDDSALTCVPSVVTADVQETVNPFYEGTRSNFPSYITDHGMGGGDGGTVSALEDCPDLPAGHPSLPVCGPGYYLHIVQLEPDLCDYICLPIISDPDAGDPPPPGHTSECNCHVYIDDRMPGGRIILEDTQLGDEGVRFVKVKTTKYYWGFIYKNTDTDVDGCWKIEKRYNVRRVKVKVVFKDGESDRVVIRAVRGARVWNTFLKPVKHKWKLRRSDKKWNDLCLTILYSTDNNSRDEQSHVAATINNALHEYYDDHLNLPVVDNKLKVLIQNWESGGSAPMFNQMGFLDFTLFDFEKFLISYGAVRVTEASIIWELQKPDIIIPMGDADISSRIKRVMYHELSHASQYTELGEDWWEDFVQYIVNIQSTGQPEPYGDGTLPGSGRAEIAEGMAECIGQYMTDLQYGRDHGFGDEDRDRPSFIMERRLFWPRGPGNFIPEGLFWDLIDENGVFPLSGPNAPNERAVITDAVSGFTYEQLMEALDGDDAEIEDYRDALWNLHGAGSGNTQIDYDQLFLSYGF